MFLFYPDCSGMALRPGPFRASRSMCGYPRRQSVHCAYASTLANQTASASASSSPSNLDPAEQPPRWARTPPRMRAPHRVRPSTDFDASDFPVNEDPRKLDEVLHKMLGHSGYKLPEEVKWLSVTHKSFDHGRRGFNDRLAFLGKSELELVT